MHRRDLLKAAVFSAPFLHLPSAMASSEPVTISTFGGGDIDLSGRDLKSFSDSLDGIVLRQDSRGYELSRQVWNGIWNKYPALIVRCASVRDVASAVKFARGHGILTTIRCGGHSMSGKSISDGGLVIDLGHLNGVEIDVGNKIAHIGGGALLGDLDRKSVPLGLATTTGVVSHTGVGGLVLGGGLGRLQRKFGLSIDNLLGVELITADGELLRASEKENTDLYWGVRGGGGNFGIVTKFIMRLHEIDPMLTTFKYTYPAEKTKEAMKVYFDLSFGATNDLFAMASVSMSSKGVSRVKISGSFFGRPSDLDQILSPLKVLGTAKSESISAIDYLTIQSAADDGFNAAGHRHYAKGGFLKSIDENLITTTVDNLEPIQERGFAVSILHMGGEVSKVGPNETVYANRDAIYNIETNSAWDIKNSDDDEKIISWNRRYWKLIEPYTKGFYSNVLVEESQKRIQTNYGENYPRLVKIKNKYDPDNFFRFNANILPEKI